MNNNKIGFSVVAVIFYCAGLCGHAQQVHPLPASLQALVPMNIFPSTAADLFEFRDRNKADHPAVFEAKGGASSSLFLTAEVTSPAKSHTDVQATWKSTGAVKRGDVMLARFAIRALYARQESGEAIVYFFINQGIAPFERNIILDITAATEWKTIDIPFKASYDMPAGEGTIGFTFGALAQKVEIASVEVLNFGTKTDVTQLPLTRFSYQGREANASWRNDALKRIEVLRTAPLLIKVLNAEGKPMAGAAVTATMLQSDFVWGTAVNERMLASGDTSADIYRAILKEMFNTAVIENGFKAGVWHGRPDRQPETLKAFSWLLKSGLRQRGHNLVWPGWKFNPPDFKKTAEADTAKFRQMIEEDIRSKMAVTKGKVIAWDVINELVHEKDFYKYLSSDASMQWFKLAKELDPAAQLFINEYGMLNSIASPKNIEAYIDLVDGLRKAGAPIEALGVQGHVGRQPRNPAQVIKDLDLFTKNGLPVQITEFDINSPDEELQADYTRDFLIACYSHPVITGFTKWGFWQGAHWKPDAAMFRKDWTPKPNAAVWREWVTKKWKTNITATSNKKGEVISRGHFGRYEITARKGGKSVTKVYHLTKNSAPVRIELR